MAAEHVWRHLDDWSFGAMNALSKMIDETEWRNPGWITSVRSGTGLVIAGDYGGDHQASAYQTFSLLIAEARRAVRTQILRDNREMAYKKLKDGIRAKALAAFLDAATDSPACC